ncbi:MAG: signal peptidase II [Oscillospiraceae bacterium]|nr:signal peptidase II [Oscillospiraceae bacterium]
MIYSLISIVLLVGLDRFSKILAVKYLSGGTPVTVIPHILGLRYTENTGAAFSMLSKNTDFLIIITIVSMAFLVYLIFIKKYGTVIERALMTVVLAGGIGNLIDRIVSGYVVDYFEFLFMNFAVFNVADIYITVGITLYLVYALCEEYKNKKDKKNG